MLLFSFNSKCYEGNSISVIYLLYVGNPSLFHLYGFDNRILNVVIIDSSYIPDMAFCNMFDCVLNISLPKTVTSIGTNAFYGCDCLKNVYYEGSQEQWGNIEIGGGNEYLIDPEILGVNIVYNYSK